MDRSTNCKQVYGSMFSSVTNTVRGPFLHLSGHQYLIYEMEIVGIITTCGGWAASFWLVVSS